MGSLNIPGQSVLYGILKSTWSGSVNSWAFLSDATHATSITPTSITFSGFDLLVNFAAYSSIGTFIVAPDAILASYGVVCGASVGVSSAQISAYTPEGCKSFLTSAGSTWTIDATQSSPGVSVSYNSGTGLITITHRTMRTQDGTVSPSQYYKGDSTDTDRYLAVSSGATTITLNRTNSAGTLQTGSPTNGLNVCIHKPGELYFDLQNDNLGGGAFHIIGIMGT